MEAIFLKLRLIPKFIIYEGLNYWYKEVWRKDADAYYCCSARDGYGNVDCGCEGMTNYEWWKRITRTN